MKKILLTSVVAATMIFASCSKEIEGNEPGAGQDSSIAYLSIKVDTQKGTRASSEHPGSNESDLLKLYMVTFDGLGKVIAVPGKTTGVGYNMVDVTGTANPNNPQAVKVSSASKNLMVIANPGPGLLTALESLGANSTFNNFNTAIAGVTTTDIVGGTDVGFAMITSGSDAGLNAGAKIMYPYVEIGDYIKAVDDKLTEEQARDAANARRLPVKLERLASKIVVRAADPIDAKGATFAFESWTVDAVNSTYYPFAEKTLLDVDHNNGVDYTKNFYTKDPNFLNNAGIVYSTVGTDFTPILPWGDETNKNGVYGWKNPGDASVPERIAYVIENTMDAPEQKFGNATRIVVKAKYTPASTAEVTFTHGADWFSWAGTNYNSLAALQTAYNEASASGALKDACDKFYKELDYAFDAIITATDFANLTPEELKDIPNGGEVVKDGNNPVLLWFQKGLCYYYFELRHDNETTVDMAFGKYGTVRNNWYDLEVQSVSRPGTPWYPDINNPGSGDPDPKDPIDDRMGYLGIDVDINDWIIWGTGIDF